MKKLFLLAFVATVIAGFTSCDDYDDTDIRNTLSDHEQRIAALEEWQNSVNENITALQLMVNTIEGRDYVTSVTTNTDGYTLTFLHSGTVTIRNGIDGTNGTNGTDGHSPVISVKLASDGRYYWTLDGEYILDASGNPIPVTGNDGKNGNNGTNGNDGLTPYIGSNGNWWIGTTDTGVKAQGNNGADGLTPFIGTNGNWWIGTTDTGVKAQGDNGADGLTPYIGSNGNWWIGTTDTGVKAQGSDGTNGTDGQSPYIGSNGNWWIGTTDTGVKAQGNDGADAIAPQVKIGDDGYWYISTDGGTTWVSTGVKATGEDGADGTNGTNGTDGTDGLTPYIGSNGNWWIGTTDTGVKAQGSDGTNGTSSNITIIEDESGNSYTATIINTDSNGNTTSTVLSLPRYSSAIQFADGYSTLTIGQEEKTITVKLPDNLTSSNYDCLIATATPTSGAYVSSVRAKAGTSSLGWTVSISSPDFTTGTTTVTVAGGSSLNDGDQALLTIMLVYKDGTQVSASRLIEFSLPLGDKALENAQVGDFYMSDGTLVDKDATLTDKQKSECIGIVFQTDASRIGDAEKEALAAKGITTPHGLVMAAKSAWTTINSCVWRTEYGVSENITFATSATKCKADINGLTNTLAIWNKEGVDLSMYPALNHAKSFNSTVPAPDKSTGWFMPSTGQWLDIMKNLGQATNTDDTWSGSYNQFINKNNGTVVTNINNSMEQITNKDKFSTYGNMFWTSSMFNKNNAYTFGFYDDGVLFMYGYPANSAYSFVKCILAF